MAYPDDIFKAAGIDGAINQAASYSRGVANTGSSKAPVAAKAPGFIQSVAGSAARALPAIGGAVAHAVADPFTKFAGSVSAAINSKSFTDTQDYQRNAINERMKSLNARYNSSDPKTKISKDQFNAGMKEIQNAYMELNAQNQQYGEQLGSPLDAVKSGAEVLTTPLAFGKLAKGAEVATGVLKGQTAAELGKAAAIGAVKAPLVTQPVAGMPVDIAQQVQRGDLGGAAINTGLLATGLLPGGAFGAAGRVIKGAGEAAKKAVYGEESLYKGIKTADGTLLNYVKTLQEKAAGGNKQAAKDLEIARIYQQYKLDETGGNVGSAVRELNAHYANRPTAELSGKEVFTDFKKFYQNTMKVKAADAAGKITRSPEQASHSARVGRFTVAEAGNLKKALNGVTDPGERFSIAHDISKTAEWGKNPIVREDILNAVAKEDFNGKLPVQALRAQGKVAGLDRGYFPILTKGSRAEFKPVAETGSKFNETKPLLPGLRNILRKTGLSTEAQDPTVYARIEKAANDKISKLGINSIEGSLSSDKAIGEQVTSALMKMIDHKIGVSDVRQLRVKEIATELGVDPTQARKIRQAISDAHFAVGTGERGLGARIQDLNLKFNPIARHYARAQGALKYELNPFFQAQTMIETEILGQGLAGPNMKGLQRLFGKDTSSKTLQVMRENGFFKGERGAQSAQGGPYVSAKLNPLQQRQLAGTAEVLAENRGITVADLMKDAKIRDELRAIVQYPERGIFSSNLAKTANLVFFPVTYNLKVATLAAKALAKTSPITQIATIKGINDFNNWLDSDAGIKWSSENSEVLGLFQYFTPINSIQSVMNILGRKGTPTTGDFGIIGGLPFGVIFQILEDHGVISTDRPYTDPKTGQVVPKNIPQDAQASAAVVLTDLINSIYNFPGRKLGTDYSKKDLTQGLVPGLKDLASGGSYSSVTRTDTSNTQKRAGQILAPAKPANPASVTRLNIPSVTATKSQAFKPQGSGSSKAKAKKSKTFARPIPQP